MAKWAVKQWAMYIDRVVKRCENCKDCAPGAYCVKHSEAFWHGINEMRHALKVEPRVKTIYHDVALSQRTCLNCRDYHHDCAGKVDYVPCSRWHKKREYK
jgi:deoxyribodipyrimidine photolyase-like uncharacterized protein